MIIRPIYLKTLRKYRDIPLVKILAGIRRCGKSTILEMLKNDLMESGVSESNIISVRYTAETLNRSMTAQEMFDEIKSQMSGQGKYYLLLDEVQEVTGWEKAVNTLLEDMNVDIYVTGSNAYLLSSEYATYLAGRSVEIKVLPLSFREFLDFHGYVVKESKSPAGGMRKRIYDTDGESYEPQELLDAYLRFGGMPGIADVGLDTDKALALLDGIYSTVVVRDILERERRRGQRQITDPDLLRKIIMFLADNIGNSTSITSISNTLVNEKLLDQSRKGNPSVHTIQAYVGALLESYIFYEIKRFDIKGKEYLRTLGKYYIVDIGLRNYLLGFRDMDTGHIIENIVYFELLRRGYDVSIGKVDNKEVDFIAANAEQKRYIQVTESMNEPTTRERELAPLRMIRDNYEKIVIAGNCNHPITEDGIKIIRLTDFLLDT